MTKWILAVGAAALAMTVPAMAERGGQGGDKQGGKGAAIKADKPHGDAMKLARGDDRGKPAKVEMRGSDKSEFRDVAVKVERRGKPDKIELRDREARVAKRDADRDNDRFDNDRFDGDRFDRRFAGRGLANGCPPGLDRKDNGCLPPGQAKKLLGSRLQRSFADSLVPQAYRSWYRDDADHLYRAGDGFIYRVDRGSNLVDGIIPLFGNGYYAPGDAWPDPYNFYNVPYQYRSLYSDTSDYRYRYGDGAIYRVGTGSNTVDAIVALLAGDLGVGQRLPMGYDAYNVPLAYRDRYADSSDAWYRYNDGYIYQVDPKTRLISAVINAII